MLNRTILATCALITISFAATAEERMPYEQSSSIKREMVSVRGGQMRDYELDHCIPLCLGGTNDRSNLQLQPWPEARIKDADEIAACRAVSSGANRTTIVQQLAAKWPCNGANQ